MLSLAAFESWPYGFYQLLRLVVAGSALYMAYHTFRAKKEGWAWPFIGIAVLFNPILPIHLTREQWFAPNVAAAAIFVWAALWRFQQRGIY